MSPSTSGPEQVSLNKPCFHVMMPCWSPDPAFVAPEVYNKLLWLAEKTTEEEFVEGYEPLRALPKEMLPPPGREHTAPKFFFGLIIAPKQYMDYGKNVLFGTEWPPKSYCPELLWADIQMAVRLKMERKYDRMLISCFPVYRKMTGMIALYSNHTFRHYFLDGHAERRLLTDLAKMLQLPRDVRPVWCRAWLEDDGQDGETPLMLQQMRRERFFKKKREREAEIVAKAAEEACSSDRSHRSQTPTPCNPGLCSLTGSITSAQDAMSTLRSSEAAL